MLLLRRHRLPAIRPIRLGASGTRPFDLVLDAQLVRLGVHDLEARQVPQAPTE